jgi:membrane protein DedA with SNARE-associated domain
MCRRRRRGWLERVEDIAEVLDVLADAGWLLPALFGVVALDALVPVLPSGTSVMLAGVLSASGRVDVVAVLSVAALGAYCGDNLVYALGRRWGRLVSPDRGGARRRRTYAWISRGLRTRPASVIIPGRFVPGVRFAVMLCAGAVGCPPRLFRRLSTSAALVWAMTMTLSGYAGGAAFGRQPLLALLLALTVGSAVMVVVEVAGKRLRDPGHSSIDKPTSIRQGVS